MKKPLVYLMKSYASKVKHPVQTSYTAVGTIDTAILRVENLKEKLEFN